jgi:diguanylate cyclase
MMDIDYFKKFNDTYGHRAGDFVLSSLAQHVKKSLRTQDFVCRFGGEEFVVIMPMTKAYDAAMVMSRIRADLQDRFFYSPYDNRDFNIHISVGVAQFPEDAADADTLVRAADEALYEAKETGRNKVVIYNHASTVFKNKVDKLNF